LELEKELDCSGESTDRMEMLRGHPRPSHSQFANHCDVFGEETPSALAPKENIGFVENTH
jgi:hypothetical protein